MGLKQDLINAKVKAAKDAGITTPLDTKPGSMIEREAEYTKEAIIKFLTEAEFTVTQFKAPIVVEDFKTPVQIVDVNKSTITEDKKPLFKTIRQIGALIPGAGPQVDALMNQVELLTDLEANRIRIQGAQLRPLNLAKDSGGLQSTGYVYIGEDPDSQGGFDVDDEDGQRQFTTVKLFREDIEDLL